MTTIRHGSTRNQGVSGPHPLRCSVYHKIRGNVKFPDKENQGLRRGVAFLAAAGNVSRPLPTRLKGLRPLVINPRIRLDRLPPWQPIASIVILPCFTIVISITLHGM